MAVRTKMTAPTMTPLIILFFMASSKGRMLLKTAEAIFYAIIQTDKLLKKKINPQHSSN